MIDEKNMAINNLTRVTEVSDYKSTLNWSGYREYYPPGRDIMYPSMSSTFRRYVLYPSSGLKNARRLCAL